MKTLFKNSITRQQNIQKFYLKCLKKTFTSLNINYTLRNKILCVKTAAGAKSLRNIKVREYDASNTSCEGQST